MVMVMVMVMVKPQGGCVEPSARQLCKEQDECKLHGELHKEGVGLETGDDDNDHDANDEDGELHQGGKYLYVQQVDNTYKYA